MVPPPGALARRARPARVRPARRLARRVRRGGRLGGPGAQRRAPLAPLCAVKRPIAVHCTQAVPASLCFYSPAPRAATPPGRGRGGTPRYPAQLPLALTASPPEGASNLLDPREILLLLPTERDVVHGDNHSVARSRQVRRGEVARGVVRGAHERGPLGARRGVPVGPRLLACRALGRVRARGRALRLVPRVKDRDVELCGGGALPRAQRAWQGGSAARGGERGRGRRDERRPTRGLRDAPWRSHAAMMASGPH